MRALSLMTSVRLADIRVSLCSGRIGIASGGNGGSLAFRCEGYTVLTASSLRLPCSTPVLKTEIRSHCPFIVYVTTRRPVSTCRHMYGQPRRSTSLVIWLLLESFHASCRALLRLLQ